MEIDTIKLLKWVENRDLNLNKRWIDASLILESVEPQLYIHFQYLGKLEISLRKEEINIFNNESSNPTDDHSEHLTISYLWVLGIYEIVRVLYERMKQNNKHFPEHLNNIQLLKQRLTRIRIPLAKLEASNHHKKVDDSIAWPVWHPEKGASWTLNSETIRNRQDIADDVLKTIEALKQQPKID